MFLTSQVIFQTAAAEVGVLGSPSLTVRALSVDPKLHWECLSSSCSKEALEDLQSQRVFLSLLLLLLLLLLFFTHSRDVSLASSVSESLPKGNVTELFGETGDRKIGTAILRVLVGSPQAVTQISETHS